MAFRFPFDPDSAPRRNPFGVTMRCFIGTLSLVLATGLSAQSVGPASQTWAQFKVAYLKAQGSNCLKDTTGLGLGAGKWFTSRWGTEVDFIDGSLKSQTGNITADEKHLLGSALFNLMPESTRWIPYLRAGVGLTRVDKLRLAQRPDILVPQLLSLRMKHWSTRQRLPRSGPRYRLRLSLHWR